MHDRFSRQSFLGPNAQGILKHTCVGLIGLGGGGSHVVQQLAHIGFGKYKLFDFDKVEESNLNRMVGATAQDVIDGTPKIKIAERVIRNLLPDAEINSFDQRWQDVTEEFYSCDIVFGCVDTFSERNQLETACRNFLIPYIDIGLDVHSAKNEPPRMTGQIILSMPGYPCMKCMDFLNDKKIGLEAPKYGDAGGRPQVVWANGVLASTAVGIVVDLLTDWTKSLRKPIFLSYDANVPYLKEDPRLAFVVDKTCFHYPLEKVGPPQFKTV